MTDKQIKLDGSFIPIEEAIKAGLISEKDIDAPSNRPDWRITLQADHIKRLEEELKAKEQECEDLKEEIKKHNDDMFKNPPEKRFYCKGCTLPYISKKLKTENDNLKETFDDLFKVQYKLADNNKKLRQCLTEIKEIAEHCMQQEVCFACDYYDNCYIEDEEIPTYDVCKLILQKISECEGNNG